ncbi:HEAT repeat domain-containing protein [Nonomuraea rhizosphaerae]|uniref:HEAT repeat domain-containing protein n=1 Tax=Nonomuraea rhizosphaerae TaxID=2665663 RepID=UPI001C5F736B|nr:HEAT repeat domain-containing protein [Nonomuraea rhizosphaerae]
MPPIDDTVRCLIEAALGDDDPDGPVRWHAISVLRQRGDLESFIEARRLCAADDVRERLLGVDIMGMLDRFVDRTLPVLRYLAASDDDIMVLYSVLIAFGHLADPRSLPSVMDLAAHADPRVRYGAAYALQHVLGDPPDRAGLEALRALAADSDADVADWASLGVALTTGGEIDAHDLLPPRDQNPLTAGGEI